MPRMDTETNQKAKESIFDIPGDTGDIENPYNALIKAARNDPVIPLLENDQPIL